MKRSAALLVCLQKLMKFSVICLLVTVFTSLGCDEDKPTKPRPAKSYPVYTFDGADERTIYRYNPVTQELFKLPIDVPWVRSLAVSADGVYLYVSTVSDIVVFSAASFDTVTTLPYAGAMVISSDGRYVAVLGSNLRILSAADYSVVYHSPAPFYGGIFSDDGDRFYYGKQDTVCAISIPDSTVSCHPVPLWVVDLRISPDETLWYIYNVGLTVYDIDADSVILQDVFAHGAGSLEKTPGGGSVFYTSGWSAFPVQYPPLSGFRIYDRAQNQVTAEISTIGIKDGVEPTIYPLRRICFTPDGEFAILESAYSFGGPFVVYDINGGEIIDFVEDEGQWFLLPVCQKQR
jgi:hypothetical protein